MRRLGVSLLFASLAVAQSSYNESHRWWNSNQDEILPWDSEYDNPTGQLRISNRNGSFRTGNHPFFKALGSNGRACVTCHQPSNAMSLSVANIRDRWETTGGKDPLFAAIDGSNCPSLPQSDPRSHSLLLNRGLFRVALPWPPANIQPDFRIQVLRDPTGCNAGKGEISVYRRPRMSANLPDLVPGPAGAVLMADGRAADLRAQAIDAALVHEQAHSAPDAESLRRILDFEGQVYATQYADVRGGLLSQLSEPATGVQQSFRNSATRGKLVFGERCASCHQPGTNRWRRLESSNLPDLPLFRVTCDSGKVIETQDPGRGLITGRCADVGAIVIPQFHGLASRPPYFSNGSAATLTDLIASYEKRLGITLTPTQKEDLANYLLTL
ncbi:MAG: hypothetical protein JSU00_25335 [Acidobacteria bacterium]|nr:hypothetical protein [Acidobacteriota bacterium]